MYSIQKKNTLQTVKPEVSIKLSKIIEFPLAHEWLTNHRINKLAELSRQVVHSLSWKKLKYVVWKLIKLN